MNRTATAQEGSQELIEQQAKLLAFQNDQAQRRDFESSFHVLLGYWLKKREAFGGNEKTLFDNLRNSVWPEYFIGAYTLAMEEEIRNGQLAFEQERDQNNFFEKLYQENRYLLAPYFTLLYRVMEHVESGKSIRAASDESLFSKDQIELHFNIVRAQFSDADRVAIIRNCNS